MEGNETVNSAPVASTGPTTFAEADWSADASSASDPSQSTESAATAEQSPGTSEAHTTPVDDRSPFIPRTRFDEVNGKYNELKSWREQHGWVDQIDQPTLQKAIEFYQGFNDPGNDPVGLLQQLAERISADPVHGAKLRSLAARQLAAARGQQQQPQAQPDEMPQPDVAITDAQGNVVGQTYSAESQAKREALLKQQWLSEIRKELEPVTQTVKEVKAQRAQEASKAFASSAFEELSSQLPEFEAHAKEIGQRLKALDLQTDEPAMLKLALKAIYADVVTPKREQQMASTAESKLLDNLQRKAAASTSVNPGSATPSTPRAVNSFHQLPREAWD
jgi:hypothetical protein